MAWGFQISTTKRSREFSAQRMVCQRKNSGCRVETRNRPVLSQSGETRPKPQARKPMIRRISRQYSWWAFPFSYCLHSPSWISTRPTSMFSSLYVPILTVSTSHLLSRTWFSFRFASRIQLVAALPRCAAHDDAVASLLIFAPIRDEMNVVNGHACKFGLPHQEKRRM